MLKRSFAAGTITSLLLCAPCGLFAQASPQDAAQHHKKKPVEWTNDNIGNLRSPADDYAIQEQQAQSQAAKQSAAPDKAASNDGQADNSLPPDLQPKTAAEADAMIAREKTELASEKEYVAQTQKDLVTAPEAEKARLQWRVQSRSQIIERIQHNIAALEELKSALEKRGVQADASSPSQ